MKNVFEVIVHYYFFYAYLWYQYCVSQQSSSVLHPASSLPLFNGTYYNFYVWNIDNNFCFNNNDIISLF